MSFFLQTCQDFESYLLSHKPQILSFHPYFEEAFWEMMKNGGKRFRPNLLLSVVCAQSKEFVFNSFDVCLAIECLHTYSLIHDDLPAMDNASLRRSHPTLHCKYDEVGAILIGDGLNTYSFSLLSQAVFAPDVKIALIESLSQDGGISGMILGQALDCYFENTKLTQEKLDFIHIHKTAKLIATSLKMGGIIANLDSTTQKNLYDFGIKLGLYFQIRDDIIDFLQDESKSGKTTQNDTNKNSYVNLLGIQQAQDVMQQYIAQLEANLVELESLQLTQLQHNLYELLKPYFQPLT
ncbi:geranyl transferase [Helicobacter didelphidarum]|uniref:Geranyl transferase n=1 Tax=Helicobacter didelphidarum TaxID=2040648 RepID=A0A3D8IP52_9HELI|nr:polyprenyl synthetase family protein [Helicobacter didelphidarum]RDU66770.1 geranyl transferase [Helicobacter didelphidarum]